MAADFTNSIAKEYGLDAGADIVGIASARDFMSSPDGFKPADVLQQCRSVIVLGSTYSRSILMDIDQYSESRNMMLTTMTDIAKKVAKRIKADGYRTKAISAAGGKWVDSNGRKEQFGTISLKHAAEIAGLGVIGKNYLLTNPQYGNLLWFSAVLTDAELVPDERVTLPTLCKDCNRCVLSCPVGALDNLAAFGKKGCSSHFQIENKKLRIKCFLCRTVCPHAFGIQADPQ